MLDPNLLRHNPAELAATPAPTARLSISTSPRSKRWKASASSIQIRTQELQNLRNTRSKAIGQAKAKGEDVRALMAEVAGFGDELKASGSASWSASAARLEAIALGIPNLPARHRCRRATTKAHNVEQHRWGTPRTFDFAVKDHVELGARNGWLDGDTAAKLSRRALHRAARPARAPASRAGAVHARPAHRRARLRGNQRAAAGQCRSRCAAPASCRSSRTTCSRRVGVGETAQALPDSDLRSAADQHRARRDRRRRRAAAAHDRAFDVLPRRSRQPRPRHPRHDPPAPVREGRAGVASRDRTRATPSTSA